MAIIIKKKSGTGIPQPGEQVKIVSGGSVVATGTKVSGSGASTQIVLDSGSAESDQKEQKKIDYAMERQEKTAVTLRRMGYTVEMKGRELIGTRVRGGKKEVVSVSASGETKEVGTPRSATINIAFAPTSRQQSISEFKSQAKQSGMSLRAEPIIMGGEYKGLSYVAEGIKIEEPPQVIRDVPQVSKKRNEVDRYGAYRAIGEANLKNPFVRGTTDMLMAGGRKVKQKLESEKFKTSFKTMTGVINLPSEIGKGTLIDLKATKAGKGVSDYYGRSGIGIALGYGKSRINKAFAILPSSEPLRTKLVSESLIDVDLYGGRSDALSKVKTGIAKTNIFATNIFSGSYEKVRTDPIGLAFDVGIGYGVGSTAGWISKAKIGRTAVKTAGIGIGGLYVGSVAGATMAEPLSKKGTRLGAEFVKAPLFMAGFSKGFKASYKPVELDLVSKEGLLYRGKSYFKQIPKTKRFGIITEDIPEFKRTVSTGTITGKGRGRIKSIGGSFVEVVPGKTIYENRVVDYSGDLFRSEYLVQEKINLAKKTSELNVIKLGKTPESIFESTSKLPPKYVSPLRYGTEKFTTRQIKSFTPERAIQLSSIDVYGTQPKAKPGDMISLSVPKKIGGIIELVKIGEKIGQENIQTGKQLDLSRRLRILRNEKAVSAEVSPSAITTIRRDTAIDLRARQTSPSKTSLSLISGYRSQAGDISLAGQPGTEPFNKIKIGEQSNFRDLYFGTERLESRRAKYDRVLYPKEVTAKLVKDKSFIDIPEGKPSEGFYQPTSFGEDVLYMSLDKYATKTRIGVSPREVDLVGQALFKNIKSTDRNFPRSSLRYFTKAGQETILKEYSLEFEPTNYFGLEKQYTPPRIKKQQKVKLSESFDIYIPTKYESDLISGAAGFRQGEISSRQKLYGQYLSGKYTTSDILKEISSGRKPVVDKKGRVLTPKYLSSINKKARKSNAAANKKYADVLDYRYKKAREMAAKEYPELAESELIGTDKEGLFQKMVETKARSIMYDKVPIDIAKVKVSSRTKNLGPIIGTSVANVSVKSGVFPFVASTTRSKSSSKSQSAYNTKQASEMNLRSENKSRSKTRSELKSNLRNELNLKYNIKTDTKSLLNLKTNLKTDLRQQSKLKTDIFSGMGPYQSFRTDATPIKPTPPPPGILDFSIYGKPIKKKKASKKIKLSTVYNPQLRSAGQRIYGKAPQLLTGIGFERPIMRGL